LQLGIRLLTVNDLLEIQMVRILSIRASTWIHGEFFIHSLQHIREDTLILEIISSPKLLT